MKFLWPEVVTGRVVTGTECCAHATGPAREKTCKPKFRLTSSAHGVRSSVRRVTSSPPKLGGVRGGLNKRYNYRGLLHWPFFRPPRPIGLPS